MSGSGHSSSLKVIFFAFGANLAQLFNVITIQFGSKVMLAAKIEFKENLSIQTCVERINVLEEKIKQEFPSIGWCFIEPDNKD